MFAYPACKQASTIMDSKVNVFYMYYHWYCIINSIGLQYNRKQESMKEKYCRRKNYWNCLVKHDTDILCPYSKSVINTEFSQPISV